jgi:alkylhydroperoxidase domain protein
VSFQVRVIAALRLLGGSSADGDASAVAARSATATAVTRGSALARVAPAEPLPAARVIRPDPGLVRPPAFTRDQLEWTPWLEPLDLADADPAQAVALEGTRGNSPYFRLLALDIDVLTERTATDRGIFYTHGGAPRAERELAAAATSRLNGCIYCASVHARLAAQLSKRPEDVDRLLDRGVSSGEELGLGERWQAIVDLAVALARTPSTATPAHVARLREIGLGDLEILDVAQAAAFFSWANRLTRAAPGHDRARAKPRGGLIGAGQAAAWATIAGVVCNRGGYAVDRCKGPREWRAGRCRSLESDDLGQARHGRVLRPIRDRPDDPS